MPLHMEGAQWEGGLCMPLSNGHGLNLPRGATEAKDLARFFNMLVHEYGEQK